MATNLLLTEEVQRRLPRGVIKAGSSGNLHKVAANLLRNAGEHVGDELTVKTALRALGKKLYIKNSEWAMVRDGLNALAGEK